MSKNKYRLDDRWKIATEKMTLCQDKLNRADELEMFILRHNFELAKAEIHRHRNVREQNFRLFLQACAFLDIPRIYLGWREIVGADDTRYSRPGTKHDTVAVWDLCDMLAGNTWPQRNSNHLNGGCGNSDQHQINHADKFFEPRRLGKAYSIKTHRPISIEPFRKRFVCTKK